MLSNLVVGSLLPVLSHGLVGFIGWAICWIFSRAGAPKVGAKPANVATGHPVIDYLASKMETTKRVQAAEQELAAFAGELLGAASLAKKE